MNQPSVARETAVSLAQRELATVADSIVPLVDNLEERLVTVLHTPTQVTEEHGIKPPFSCSCTLASEISAQVMRLEKSRDKLVLVLERLEL